RRELAELLVELIAARRRRLAGREADDVAGFLPVAVGEEQLHLLDARLVPRGAARRARLDDLLPAGEGGPPGAERRRRPRRPAERLGRRRLLRQRLVVEPARLGGVLRAQLEVGESHPIRRRAAARDERAVDLAGEGEGGGAMGLVAGVELLLQGASELV